MPFQSPRPRGRTRRDTTLDFIPHGLFQSPRPRVMTRHRYKCRPGHSDCFNPRALAISQSRALAISRSRALAISQSRNLAISRSRNLALSQSRNLAISRSRNLAIMDCSLQAAGERKVKTMAKICQAETAIRGSLRVHDKRKPLNARRMPMHSFVSTPLQGTLDPME